MLIQLSKGRLINFFHIVSITTIDSESWPTVASILSSKMKIEKECAVLVMGKGDITRITKQDLWVIEDFKQSLVDLVVEGVKNLKTKNKAKPSNDG